MKVRVFLLISLLSFCILPKIFSQDSDADAQFDQSINVEEGEIPHAQGQETPQFSEEQINAMRTRTMSCILLTKHKIYALQKELGPVLEGFSSKQMEQNALYRKIFAEMLEICYTAITDQEGTKFMEEVQKREFNVNDFNHIVEKFSLEKYKAKTVNVKMTDMQKQLFKYAEEFDKVMKEKQEKEEELQEEQEKLTPEDYEPKIAGFSLKSSPAMVKLGYIAAIFSVFGIVIYWGLKTVFAGSNLVGDKVKQQKKGKKKD